MQFNWVIFLFFRTKLECYVAFCVFVHAWASSFKKKKKKKKKKDDPINDVTNDTYVYVGHVCQFLCFVADTFDFALYTVKS